MVYAFDLLLKKKLTKLWIKEGMPKIKHVITDLLTSGTLNLVAVDPLFCPQQKEWSHQHYISGFLNLPTYNENWQISEDLLDFLNSGSTPNLYDFW